MNIFIPTYIFIILYFYFFAVPPKLSPFYVDKGLHLGERTTIICTVTKGDPPLSINWFKDGHPLVSGPGISVTQMNPYNRVLLIESLTPEHNGNYSCVAKNAAATVTHTQKLMVNGNVFVCITAATNTSFFLGSLFMYGFYLFSLFLSLIYKSFFIPLAWDFCFSFSIFLIRPPSPPEHITFSPS